MPHQRTLMQTALVTVTWVEHDADPSDDYTDYHSINFVDRGRFALAHGRRTWSVGRTELFVTVPGLEYRCRQTEESREIVRGVCLDIVFSDLARDTIQGHPVGELRAVSPIVSLTNRGAYLRRRLSRHLEQQADPLAVDIVAGELLHSTLMEPAQRARFHRPSQLAWYADRVDRVRELLDTEFASPRSLRELAKEAGMSPYHFARVFRELTGVPPHRYLVRRRLAVARERLRRGDSVTATCYAVGFGQVSHFIHAFRSVFGMTPSRYANDARSSINLEAGSIDHP